MLHPLGHKATCEADSFPMIWQWTTEQHAIACARVCVCVRVPVCVPVWLSLCAVQVVAGVCTSFRRTPAMLLRRAS